MKTRPAQSARRTSAFLAVLALAWLLLTSCGGGGGGSGNTYKPPAPSGPSISTASLPNAYTGYWYDSGPLEATGGSPPYQWSVTSLPPGLGVTAPGVDCRIIGTPTQAGSFDVVLQVTDSRQRSDTRTLSLTVKTFVQIVLQPLPEGRVNLPYSFIFQATDGTPPYTWSWSSYYGAPLPPGLDLSADGTLSGTPTVGGSYGFNVTVHDAEAQTATVTPGLTIRALEITTSNLPVAQLNEPYSYTLEAVWGDVPLTWSLQAGSSLPAGLSLSASGIISGTPTEAGSRTVTVKVQDASQQTATATLWIEVLAPVEITTSSLPDGNIATAYYAQLTATGGWGWYSWNLEPGGTLPAGLALEPGGSLRGTPTVAGTFPFTVRATSGDLSATKEFTLFIDNRLAILTTQISDGAVTGNYRAEVQAMGGTTPYTWSITGGTAGPRFTIDASTGQITGVPTEAGTFTLIARAQDSSTPIQAAGRTFSFQVFPPPSIQTVSLPDAAVHGGYDSRIEANGGLPPVTLSVAQGQLPPGLTLSDFRISGDPTAAGDYTFTLQLADASSPPLTATHQYTIHVNEELTITTDSLPDGNVGDQYFAQLQAQGGIPPYTWFDWDTLWPLIVSSNGTISGVPRSPSALHGFVTVSDSSSNHHSVDKTFSVNVTAHPKIRTSRLPAAKPNAPYRVALNGTGWYEPFSWSITSGSLPDGLTLSPSTGTISGTPTHDGTQTFAVRFQDSAQPPESDERTLSLSVIAAPGRNDSPATATPISNGTFRASISPYSDPVDGPAFPDNDYYVLTANPGAIVTLETMADRLTPPSPLDSVIEIVDAGGNRFTTCRPVNDSYGAYNRACLNDDFDWYNTLDSKLEFQVPGAGTDPVTFYVHVLDWSGSARPDFVYDLIVSGAN